MMPFSCPEGTLTIIHVLYVNFIPKFYYHLLQFLELRAFFPIPGVVIKFTNRDAVEVL